MITHNANESLTQKHERLKCEFTKAFYDYAAYKLSLKDLQVKIDEYLKVDEQLIAEYRHVIGRDIA